MAAAPHLDVSTDPVLPHRSRIGLFLWFATQWFLIPLGFVGQVLMVLTGQSHVSEVLDPVRAFLSPYKLLLRLSRSRSWHEKYLDRKFARISQEIKQQRFSFRTSFSHEFPVLPERESDTKTGVSLKSREIGIQLKPRYYRGLPVSTLKRLAHAHHLDFDSSRPLSLGIDLFLHPEARLMRHTAADAPPSATSSQRSMAPALPLLPRWALLLWFIVQWIVIPLEAVARCLLLAFKLVADAEGANSDGIDPRRAVARATSPRSLRFQMSRDPAKRRAHLDRKIAELAEQIRTQRFTLGTSVFHAPRWNARKDSKGLTLRPRDYRGLPENTIEEIIASHGLRVSGDDTSLRIWEGQLWTELV
ncbi:hypothetical protein [Streptomyces acidicola]|uniref:hypothetical protein n=1 Tax=Streptomyces acidicola TaxID=2596892 RepID=UPI003804CB8F